MKRFAFAAFLLASIFPAVLGAGCKSAAPEAAPPPAAVTAPGGAQTMSPEAAKAADAAAHREKRGD